MRHAWDGKNVRNNERYPADVSDEECEFCVPYLTLMGEEAPQRGHSLRTIFNALRWMVRAGCPWRLLPPWRAVHQQTLRGIRAGVFRGDDPRSKNGAGSFPNGPFRLPQSSSTGGPCSPSRRGRSARRLRWPQTPQGLQGAYRRGRPGLSAGLESHGGPRTGTNPGRCTRAAGASCHRGVRQNRLC